MARRTSAGIVICPLLVTADSAITALLTYGSIVRRHRTLRKDRSEADAEADLKALDVVAAKHARRMLCRVERHRIARAHEAEREQHFEREPGRSTQLRPSEAVVER